MSSMTENLLLEAQSLRLEGESDASIDLLRAVLSQCNADLRSSRCRRRRPLITQRVGFDLDADGRDRGEDDDDDARDGSNGIRGPNDDPTSHGNAETTRRMRRMASYQLALLLLQRSGRRNRDPISNDAANRDVEARETRTASQRDEREADEILWEMGYRLRLSNLAFGYPMCGCRRQYPYPARQSIRTESSAESLPLVVVDDVLPPSLFDALKHAFRPESKYWSEFYRKVNDDNDTDTIEDDSPQRKGNRFASHNILLPSADATSSSSSSSSLPSSDLRSALRRSKSLLEQVAIVVLRRLRRRFPDLANATSVEAWSHRRPTDGHHQLHYDLDEIRLWERRKRGGGGFSERDVGTGKDPGNETSSGPAGSKRRKTQRGTYEADADRERRTSQETTREDVVGISCPIASCVLTMNVPDCGGGAPTIVCDQSATRSASSNVGWLCPPRSNQLLAFEGSLLHGVVPGTPSPPTLSSRGDDGDPDPEESEGGPLRGDDERVTLMLGFWKEVRLTTPAEASDGSASSADVVGPNVPLGDPSRANSWSGEFRPISIGEDFIAGAAMVVPGGNHEFEAKEGGVDVLDPLWVPIRGAVAAKEKGFVRESTPCSSTEEFYGRFFLKSLDPRCIDHEVLYGA